jgi:hypothetical protein
VGTTPTFSASEVPVGALTLVPGAVGQLAFGKYLSPDHETADKVIPPIGTRSGIPVVQGMNEIFFILFVPRGEKPADGWPVALFGHGNGDNKDFSPYFFAPRLASRGIATLAINAVGHGGGPLGTLTFRDTDSGQVSFLSGGRGIDQNGDGVIAANEGMLAAVPQAVATQLIITVRDGIQQTVADLMQLVREIEVGMDFDGDGVADLDPSRIYYFGQSLGGIYGTAFLAVEPAVSAGVSNVAGGSIIEASRLSTTTRSLIEQALASRVPPLTNVGDISMGDFRFDENLPLRNQPPVINTVPGAIAIQEVIENAEWVAQAGGPVTYASHLRKQPLAGVPTKAVLYQFARGDQNIPNPTTTAILRAGDLADRAIFYRHDLAFADPARNPTGVQVPKNPHNFLFFSPFFFPAVGDVGAGALRQIAEFFASDGDLVIDPDGAGPLFEVPIVPPLPEDLGFIP